jgi:hypothetical protein
MPCELTQYIKPKKNKWKWKVYQYEMCRNDKYTDLPMLYYTIIFENKKGNKIKTTLSEEKYLKHIDIIHEALDGFISNKKLLKLLSL